LRWKYETVNLKKVLESAWEACKKKQQEEKMRRARIS
jgi:hypothetical protein